MPRYPKKPLEQKLAWMRERQRQRESEEQQAKLMVVVPPLREETPAERKMLRVNQVAQELSVSVSTVQRWFADRALIVRPGPRKTTMLISRRTLDDWKREHTGPSKKTYRKEIDGAI